MHRHLISLSDKFTCLPGVDPLTSSNLFIMSSMSNVTFYDIIFF